MSETRTSTNYLPDKFRLNSIKRVTLERQPAGRTWSHLVKQKLPLKLDSVVDDNIPTIGRLLFDLNRAEWNERFGNDIINYDKLRTLLREDRVITLFDLLAFADFTNTEINISFTPRKENND